MSTKQTQPSLSKDKSAHEKSEYERGYSHGERFLSPCEEDGPYFDGYKEGYSATTQKALRIGLQELKRRGEIGP